ncbi:hypothetical protein LCGC14_0612020 [marine sediment metagenome]|uniref:PseI/NeuA/B-like domain-containing protein n=1 Tax=marine sediment metagenome TaxID=412755 RepID=A0A0F9UFY6_9ZZZZ
MFDLSKPFIIGEAGTCHASPNVSERLGNAKRYVLAAKDAGADSCKFQMFDNTDLFCPYEGDELRKPRWLDSWMTFGEWCQVKEFTEACGMMFLASVFQHSMVEQLGRLGVEATKVASRAAKKFPYGKAPKPYLISTGMLKSLPLEMSQIDHGHQCYRLQCESKYPSTVQWSNDPDLQHEGFSDHSGTPERAIDALSRGCKLIEVHFYIDRLDAGPDLPASLNLDQLKTVCEARDK